MYGPLLNRHVLGQVARKIVDEAANGGQQSSAVREQSGEGGFIREPVRQNPCQFPSLEVCAAFPAITAIGKGYEAYVPVDACGTFSHAKHEAGLLRMQQAGVILSDYATLAIEILKDNGRPDAGAVYEALAMPFAVLVGQIAHAYGK